MISKEEFLKQLIKEMTPELMGKNNRQKELTQKLKIIYPVLYILGVIFICLVWKLPKRDPNVEPLLLIGDYLSLIIPALIVPILPLLSIYAAYAIYSQKKGKANFGPVIYPILGIKKIPKDKKTIEQLQDIGLIASGQCGLDDTFEIWDEKYRIIVQEVKIFGNKNIHFWGPIITFNLNFSYHTILLILDNNITKTPLWLQNYAQHKELKKISLEDVKFINQYQVFGLDQIKARTILTPAFMERLQNLRDIYQAPVSILFNDNKIILVINVNRNMFEFFDYERQIMLDKCENFYDEISALFNFEKILKLK